MGLFNRAMNPFRVALLTAAAIVTAADNNQAQAQYLYPNQFSYGSGNLGAAGTFKSNQWALQKAEANIQRLT